MKIPLTKSNLLERIDEAEVFRKYLKRDPDAGGLTTNPMRNDSNPGCSFYTSTSGRLFYKDWATGEAYDCFRMVQKVFNLSFYQVLEKINDDFGIGLGTDDPLPPIDKTQTFTYSNGTIIQIVPKEYTQKELGYWRSHGISRDSLKKWGVYSVDKVYINKKFKMRSTESNPIFGYVFPDQSIKIYRPLASKKDKWRGNSSYIFGWNTLPLFCVDKPVIITSSFKDAMYLNELGYYVVAPQAESHKWSKEDIETLKELFSRVIVFYDNDDPGKQATKRLCKKYKLEYILIPDGKPKDITDLHKQYNKELIKRWLKIVINGKKDI